VKVTQVTRAKLAHRRAERALKSDPALSLLMNEIQELRAEVKRLRDAFRQEQNDAFLRAYSQQYRQELHGGHPLQARSIG
jgi:hypothetical protein